MKIPKPRKRGQAYRIEIMIDGERHSATRDTAKECEQWAAQQLLNHRSGVKIENKQSITFRELVNLYYVNVGQHSPSKRQIREQLNAFEWKFGQLCDFQIHQITPKHLTDWRNLRLKKVSKGTVLKEISLFSSMFSYAKKELFAIDRNPWMDISKPPAPANRLRRISQDEIDAIISAAEFDYNFTPVHTRQYVAWMFLFALETAMRKGEILAIEPSYIFIDHIHVPKSKNGTKRDVPLSEQAKTLLSILPDGRINKTDNALKKSWQRLMRKTGIHDLHFHDTRHEAISRMVNNKRLPVEILAKITGHKKIDVLINTYYNPTAKEIVNMFNR